MNDLNPKTKKSIDQGHEKKVRNNSITDSTTDILNNFGNSNLDIDPDQLAPDRTMLYVFLVVLCFQTIAEESFFGFNV